MRNGLPSFGRVLTAFLPACAPALAQEGPPVWEVGAGVATLSIPDYRGSDKRSSYVLPLPYLVYRGETVRVDREGVHADIFRSDRVELDVSLNAGPPAKSSDNGVRTGMPDIEPTVEAGPAIKVLLAASGDRDRGLSPRLPWRAVVATDLARYSDIGWTFTPSVQYRAFDLGPGGGWNFGVAVGPVYASERYHDYYYEVSPAYAGAARPAYDARGGYGGLQTMLTLSKRYPGFWVGLFARYDDLSGAVFEDSPLVRRKDSLMFGGGVSWVFARSERTARAIPEDLLR